ncbi:MAG: PAS domain S-box protein [Verrucomicrobiota bacterium]
MKTDPPHTPASPVSASWVKGGGEMGRRMREFDWSQHPLGPLNTWPQSLKTTISLMLNSRFAMWMGWGPEFWFFCNDAYLPTLGLKKDWLGEPATLVWKEIWQDVGPRAESVVSTGVATWDEGLRLFLERSGFPEETYHTFSYSPIPGDDENVGGMLCVVTEETERIISERRLSLLRDLATGLTGVTTEADLCAAFQHCIEQEPKDLPFALIYLAQPCGEETQLSCCHGVSPGHRAAPARLRFGGADNVWPLACRTTDPAIQCLEDLHTRFEDLPGSAWDKPSSRAAIIPILQQGADQLAGHLVVGLNPYRPFDAPYQGFLELLAGQISAALSNVRAYERQIRRAEELAAIDRAKTVFFSNVSHEFRTPLTLMLGPLEDLLGQAGESASGSGRELLSVAHRNGLRLLKLVNTLLDFSRLEAGRLEAAFEPLDLAAVTADLAESFAPAMKRAGLDFHVECPPLREPVFVDRDLWEKIVLNLISNAFKFTLKGSIHISLQDGPETVELAVTDTGAGIPKSAQSNLFERFFRVQGTEGRSHEGTGIGLALVAELVKLHGGNVTVESQPGLGSTFTVRIPRGRDHLPAEQVRPGVKPHAHRSDGAFLAETERWQPGELPAEPASAPPLANPSDSPRKRILLADDNADMREYVSHLLSTRFEVQTVADGQAALAAIETWRPDLVLSDVMMPRLDGFGLLHALRQDPATRTIPIILLSARAGEEARVEGLDAGADDYLIKPFDSRELLARVSTHLSLAQSRQESARQASLAEERLQHMLTLLPAAVYSCDQEGRITFFNPRAAELWKRTPNLNDPETRFCGFHRILLEDGSAIAPDQSPMAEAVLHGKSFRNMEAEVERPDGTRFTASVSIDPLWDDQGRIIGAINIFQDVTESRATASALKRELEDRQRDVRHATFLSALSQQLSLLNDPGDILREASEKVGMHLECDRCWFGEVADSFEWLTITEDWTHEGAPRLEGRFDPRDFASPALWEKITSQVVAVEDVAEHELTREFAPRFESLCLRSFAVAPFSNTGPVRTLLAAGSARPRNWREDELRLLDNVVSRVRPLVEQARAAQDVLVRGERMQLLSETLAQLLGARNPETVVRELFAKVTMHLRADTYFNFMVTPAGDALELHSCAGIDEETARGMHRLNFGQAVCGTVAQTCQSIVANDIQNSDYDKADLVRGLGIQTYACNPLIAGGELLGTLSFASRVRTHFDEEELKFIRIVTHSAALVLEQLKSSEARQRLASIVTSSDDAIISKNLDGIITSWNLGAQRMFGYSADEMIGKPVLLLLPADRHDEEPAILDRIRSGEYIHHYETVRQRKDGGLVDISLTISPIKDAEGRIIGASKIGRDITERRKNELELGRREQLYRSIGESINYGIWVCDAEGRSVYTSESFLKLVGITQEQCANDGWGAVLHPDDAESTLAEWQEICRQGGIWEKELRYKGVDGQWHPVLSRGIPIRNPKGEIVQWAGINLDISTFKKTEEALRQQSKILAVLNHVSSSLVAERNLEKIVQSVTDASREISGAQFGAFFYNVTNEKGEAYTLYTLSGVPREAFAKFPMPRNTELFGPTFRGEGVVRVDDVLADARYGKNAPYHGMPAGHLPVRSYLAVPVVSSSGQVIGGMFFGHDEPGVFTEATEGLLMGMAAQAAIAIDNAELYTSLHRELEQVKRVETALRASERRWRDMAEAMPHLVWTSVADGSWDFVSPQWCTYTGRREEEQRGHGWAEAVHPEDRQVLEKAWNEAAHTRSIVDVEVRIRRADGQYRWFKTRAMPVMDESGNIIKWYGSNTDIEDIKLTDTILREREARLSAIFAQAGSGIVQTNLEGGITMVNDAYCEIVARTRDELLGMNVHAITHPEDRTQNMAVFEAMIKGGSSFIIEKRDILPDGTYVWVRNSVVGIRNGQGHVIAGLIITQDITDSREAENALRASEEQLRLVTDHAPVLLAQFDQQHRYKFVNRPYADRYGFEPQEVIGKHARDVVSDSAYRSALPMMERAFRGERVEFEMAIPYEALGPRWGHVIFVPERSAEGEVVGIVSVLTDITMRKQAENDLEQARDRALEAVRAKDDFLARLSHELRTPLSPVLLLASEGSKSRDIPESARADFETIRKNVDLEARLIDDLLDITRITRGKLALDLHPMDLNDIIRDALATIRGEADGKQVRMDLDLSPTPLAVMADAVRLQQVLWNLLNNAVKFTAAHGSIRIATRLEDDGRSVCVEVSDTGIGMTEDEILRIFDAFSQGDHAVKGGSQHFGGLGLGLAITRMLVDLHQGQISASSAGRGQGATFVVKLPRVTDGGSLTVPSLPPQNLSAPAAPAAPLPPLRILLVEDHEPTRIALSSLLRRRRHEVSTAGSLAEARVLAADQSFDLLISDLGLPDGTGYELMEELAAQLPLKGIAVSGFGMEQDLVRSRNAGFVTHLIKPVRIEALEAALAVLPGR